LEEKIAPAPMVHIHFKELRGTTKRGESTTTKKKGEIKSWGRLPSKASKTAAGIHRGKLETAGVWPPIPKLTILVRRSTDTILRGGRHQIFRKGHAGGKTREGGGGKKILGGRNHLGKHESIWGGFGRNKGRKR